MWGPRTFIFKSRTRSSYSLLGKLLKKTHLPYPSSRLVIARRSPGPLTPQLQKRGLAHYAMSKRGDNADDLVSDESFVMDLQLLRIRDLHTSEQMIREPAKLRAGSRVLCSPVSINPSRRDKSDGWRR